MGRRVQVNNGYHGISLPDGNTYDGLISVVLTDAQYATISSTAFTSGVLTDLGSVGTPGTVVPPGNPGGAPTGAAGGGLAGTYPNPTVVTGAAGTSLPLAANDSSTTNARTPIAHAASHASTGSDAITITESQVANLISDLAKKADLVAGVIPRAQVPNITSVFTVLVASQAAMLALTQPDADTSIQAVRSDTPGTVYWLNPGLNPATLSNWIPVADDAAGAASAVQALSMQKSANGSDIASPSAFRVALGLGTAATQPTSAFDAAGAATTAQTNAAADASAKVAAEATFARAAEATRLIIPTDNGVAWSTGATTTAGQVWTYVGGRYLDTTGAGGVLPAAPSTPRFIFLGVDTTGVGQGLELAYAENRTSRVVTDGVLNSTTTVTSATAAFSAADIGRQLNGTGLPSNTSIVSINSPTSVVVSAAATATSTGVTLTLDNQKITAVNGSFVDMIGLTVSVPASSRPVWLRWHNTFLHSAAGGGYTVQVTEISNGTDTPITRGFLFAGLSAAGFNDKEQSFRVASSTARSRNFKLQAQNNATGVLTLAIPKPTDLYENYLVAEAH